MKPPYALKIKGFRPASAHYLMLKLDRSANAWDKAVDIILVGVKFILHVLQIRCDGKIVIEYKAPVNLGHLGVVKVIFAV